MRNIRSGEKWRFDTSYLEFTEFSPMRSLFLILYRLFIILPIVSSLQGAAVAQGSMTGSTGVPYRETHRIAIKDSVIRLQHQFIVPRSERIMIDTFLLQERTHYILDPRHGILTLHPAEIRRSLPRLDSATAVLAEYRALPFTFQDAYQHRVPVRIADTATKKTILVGTSSPAFSLEDIFGPGLQKSGSLVRGFTIGSNRDLSLNSGLRLQMSGNLTSDLLLVAALTDESSPLQPEGTTKTLQEVDNVFVEIRGNKAGATLGDFNVGFGGTEFGRVDRKLQGARANASFDIGGIGSRVTLVGAAPRGKFATNQFEGLDGVQGPYLLYGQNNENEIVVIAGTERVYLNGEQLTRGDVNDYTIDYSTAEVTFTPRRLISRASRITVDFEYSDRQYDRTFLGGTSEQSFLSDRYSLKTTFFRESDDENSPIDISLADSDKALLRQAGGNPLRASRSGVRIVGPGKGQYVSVDTLVKLPGGSDTSYTVYDFNPFDTLHAIYTVSFQYVGAGNGDYDKITVSQFRFAGIRQGGYLPIVSLPLPTAHSVADFAFTGTVSDDFRLNAEYAYSAFNGNLFSPGSSAEQDGDAGNVGLSYTTKNLRLGDISLGGIEIRAHDRRIGENYRSLDRLNDVEFDRLWNITDSTSAAEEDREGSLVLHPSSSVQGTASLGEVRRGDVFSSTKVNSTLRITGNGAPLFDYGIDEVWADDAIHTMSSVWLRQHGLLTSRFGKITPALTYAGEVLEAHQTAADSLLPSSYRMNEIQPSVSLDSIGKMNLRLAYTLRLEDSLSEGNLRHAVSAHSQHLGWGLQDWNSFSSSLELTLQQKYFFHPFIRSADDKSIALRWQGRYSPESRILEGDGFYEVVTERTAKQERVFQQVQVGTGNYIYAGDLNHDHIVDEADFTPVRFDGNYIALLIPTDQLVPDVGVKVGSRLRFNGSQVSAVRTWYGEVIGALSSETYIRLEEKSTDPEKSDIYLLRLSHFLNDALTIEGTNLFSQDIFLFENNPGFSLRFRYNQNRGLSQLALGGERTYVREQSVRLRWQLIPEVSNQTTVSLQRNTLTAAPGNPRLRDIKLTNLSTEWVYRPVQRIELGMVFGTARGTNYDSVRVSLNNQSLRAVYSFNERGQGRIEFTREEVRLGTVNVPLPFELTGGKVTGIGWLWHLGFDYRITQFLQTSLMYDGRSEGTSSAVHTAKAEVRAFF